MDFKPPRGLLIDENVSNNWTLFKQKFENFLLATGNEGKGDKVKIAMLLNCIGDEAMEIYNTFKPEDADTLEKVTKLYDSYFTPRKNVVYNRYKFFTRVQQESEAIEHYITALKSLAKSCEFKEDEESLIRDRVVIGIVDKQLQEVLLRESDLTLSKAMNQCRAAELSRQQSQVMQGKVGLGSYDSIGLHTLKKKGYRPTKPKFCSDKSRSKDFQNNKTSHNPNTSYQAMQADQFTKTVQTYKCLKCGNEHSRGNCPAYGKICKKCGLKNHFAIGCQSANKNKPQPNRAVHEAKLGLEEIEDICISVLFQGDTNWQPEPEADAMQSKDGVQQINTDVMQTKDDVQQINSVENKVNLLSWMQPVTINKQSVNFKLDSGAQCNVLPDSVLSQLKLPKLRLKPNNVRILTYDNQELNCVGNVILDSEVNGVKYKIRYVVVKTKSVPILGLNACVKLNLLQRVNSIQLDAKNLVFKNDFVDKHKEVFTGIGKFPKKLSLELKEGAKSVINSVRRVPESIKPKLKEVLDRLMENKIIESVDYPTDWVNNIVIVEKPDKSLRICLDPAQLNECVKLDPYPIPSANELELLLRGKSYFTVLDMKDGFHQVELDHDSSLLTTFITPFGKFKYNKLPFGLRVSPEIFQKYNVQMFGDIPNVGIYFDDFIIATESEREHNEVLNHVMLRALQNNVKFNPKKLQFKVSSVKYLGMIFSKEGVAPEPERVKSIVALKEPQSKKELQSVLGVTNYLSKFVHNMSQLTEPLRQLLKKNVDFVWTKDHSEAFKKLKSKIAETTSLKIFDPKKDCEIFVDSSNYGYGACLLQNGCPIAFTSKALTDTEVRYPIIDKEMAAMCFALSKYHKFIYGHKVTVYTDHKPLVSIVSKNMHKVSNRLQKFKLDLLKYNIEVKYLPGKSNVLADLLSRQVNNETNEKCDSELERSVMVHSLSNQINMSESKKLEFKTATENDEVLKSVVRYIYEGWPMYKSLNNEVKPYHKIKDELSFEDGLLFFGNKIIVPSVLRQGMLNLVHESHLGVVKCKAKARQILYWPNLNRDIENLVLSCQICEKYRFANGKEPLLSHEKANRPWQFLYSDILEYGGQNYLVVSDAYSNWIELRLLCDKSTSSVIKILKSLFSQFGVPDRFVTDNVPFSSQVFKSFANEYSFTTVTSSPFYPRSNGRSEKAVAICKNLLRRARDSGKDIQLLLLDYRNTPLNNVNVSPAQLFLNRVLKSKMPVRTNALHPKIVLVNRSRIDEKSKLYYDKTSKLLSSFQKGDNVLIQKGKQWITGKVIDKLNFPPRSYVVQDRYGQKYRRNRIMLRKCYSKNNQSDYSDLILQNDDRPNDNEFENVIQRPNVVPDRQNQTTRFGRVIRKPNHLNDFV